MIYPIDFPFPPRSERLILNRRQSRAESPWTFASSTVHTASQWALEWTWPPVSHARAERLDAWLQSLKGQVGSFRYAPRQPYIFDRTGLTLHSVGHAYNDTVRIAGWAAGQGSGLRLGQFAQIGTQLFRVIEAQAFADASGTVTVSFSNEFRVSYAVGTVVNFVNPRGIFSLASSDGQGFTLTPDRTPEFRTIQAREVI